MLLFQYWQNNLKHLNHLDKEIFYTLEQQLVLWFPRVGWLEYLHCTWMYLELTMMKMMERTGESNVDSIDKKNYLGIENCYAQFLADNLCMMWCESHLNPMMGQMMCKKMKLEDFSGLMFHQSFHIQDSRFQMKLCMNLAQYKIPLGFRIHLIDMVNLGFVLNNTKDILWYMHSELK